MVLRHCSKCFFYFKNRLNKPLRFKFLSHIEALCFQFCFLLLKNGPGFKGAGQTSENLLREELKHLLFHYGSGTKGFSL